ncbi:hypothetical protein LOAG_06711 [Loa loa]|uniref:Uncharacterized protein n=1 Tax=Loa loa TaxID=7209 RepID=A0A1S0TXA1_LOALO|nr:hypothetical protein LOAG_06711 [Loa loa]EFO21781.2 hypothetical protein LOAG_06711 [Loa loa]
MDDNTNASLALALASITNLPALNVPAYYNTTSPTVGVRKCYSCSSENILKRWPQDGSNHIHYLRQLPYFANESCDRVKKSLPVVSCHKSVCVKLVILNPPFGHQICEHNPTIVRDCWSRAMWMDMDRSIFRRIIQDGSTKIQLMDTKVEHAEGILYACNGYLCNGGTTKLHVPFDVTITVTFILFLPFIAMCM